jgi:hypothetical protein
MQIKPRSLHSCYASIIHQYRFLVAMSLSPQARTPAALHQSTVKIIAAVRIMTFLVLSGRMSLPEPFELVVGVAETLLAVLAVCCDCVNGTGDAVIEFVLELTNMLLLSDVPVSYAAKYVRLGASVQKNDTAPSSV